MSKSVVDVAGIAGGTMSTSTVRTQVKVHTLEPDVTIDVAAQVLRRIEIRTPSCTPSLDVRRLFPGLRFADPAFTTPDNVDIVFGANTYALVVRPGFIRRGTFVAQRTAFGWSITGGHEHSLPSVTSSLPTLVDSGQLSCCERLIGLIQRFWSLEEVPQFIKTSPTHTECENLYAQLHARDSTGRYVVPLLIKGDGLQLVGESLAQARRALASTHRRMKRDQQLNHHYISFMDDYLALGHMRPVTPEEQENEDRAVNYLPHHAIWQRGDGHQRLRVVFNASCPTSTGYSLNDALHSGPKLQNNIVSVVTRWRRHRIAFCADIKMMFRQIRVREADVNLQRIIWSKAENEPEEHYVLLTVTYGEASAPYLALRTLQQLCVDEGALLPEAVNAVQSDLYVDDFLTGADDEVGARRVRDQLIQLLSAGGFALKKWVSNAPTLLEDLPAEDHLRPSWVNIAKDGPVSELGLAWDPHKDCFRFAPPSFEATESLTKRGVVAEVARLFDPAGWLAPVVVVAKMFIQDLWRAKLDWDVTLPASMSDRWELFRARLAGISSMTLPRWFQLTPRSRAQLHAFADASRRAIAAVVYVRVEGPFDHANTSLVAAKTKLTPIRGLLPPKRPVARMTIPRLELRASLLAARLTQSLKADLGVAECDCHLWSDSTTVLHWLGSGEPSGNDLVDSYVHLIHEVLPFGARHYVPSEENPADVASRGTDPSQLQQSPLWWSGPSWLTDSPDAWPAAPQQATPTTNQQFSLATQLATSRSDPPSRQAAFIERFSCLLRLLKGVVQCRRRAHKHRPQPVSPTAPIGAKELQQAFLVCARLSQADDFTSELHDLREGLPVKVKSPLKGLDVFLDESGLMRVGGRLHNSLLDYEERHPPVLGARSHLSALIIDWAHQRALHGGTRLTHAYAMRKAWLVRGASSVVRRIRDCLVCAKAAARPMSQIMAPLPSSRVTPSRPFSRTGVDYAGPYNVLRSRGRGVTTTKGYVALFVCLCTKAVHLELVGDLTTASFLGALSRFVGRRGKPKEIWSDNATNFHGADNELRRFISKEAAHWGVVAKSLAEDGIEWCFIPPSAPHFGGLWEAGVKSMKNHLRRVAGSRSMTFEEFSTLLVGIETVMNCRPLGPLRHDTDDIDALTPSHFLVGSSLAALPSSPVSEDLDRLTHWELVKGTRDLIWRRWSRDYLNTLQQRAKWTRRRKDLGVGDLVLIIDSALLTRFGKWPLGRVTAVKVGRDGHVRVAQVKTKAGDYLRPITKLVHLPVNDAPQNTPEGAGSTQARGPA